MKYEITGEPMPVVICQLESGEAMKNQSGSMCWMSPNMDMQTIGPGGLGRAFGRIFSGESIFQNTYTAQGPGMIAFASSFPGSVRAVNITPDRPVIVQKTAFLCSETGVELSIFFQRKFGVGVFGGEGFIMQKLTGNGTAFLELDGSTVEYELKPGQQIVVDTGHLAMMDATCTMDVQTVKGVKNVFFGGEGLFHTVVTGPGRVVLQTMPVSVFANTIVPYLPIQGDK